MSSILRPALVFIVAFTLLTGVIYPLSITGLARVLYPDQANGSLVIRDGKVVGSSLVGQSFASDRYFHGRPSAAGNSGYDASASSGSNLGPLSAKLVARVRGDADKLRAEGATVIPADSVTTSASGLDPDISPAFAMVQAARIAKARGVAAERVEALVAEHTQGADLGMFGEPRVNVLHLNIALDAAFGRASG